MKNIVLFLSFSIAVFSFAASTTVNAQEGRFYKMVCRKGGASSVFIDVKDDNSIVMSLNFRKSSRAASSLNTQTGRRYALPLEAGQCAWVDRKIRSDEPGKIEWTFRNYTLFSVASTDGEGAAYLFRAIPHDPVRLTQAQLILGRIASHRLLNQRPRSEPDTPYFTIHVRGKGRSYEVQSNRFESYLDYVRSGRHL